MQAKTVSLLLLGLMATGSALLASVEAVAVAPPLNDGLLPPLTLNDGDDFAEETAAVGSFRMQQQSQQQQPEVRWKRGAEMALLLAHVCNQYKRAGVPPPAKYKCS